MAGPTETLNRDSVTQQLAEVYALVDELHDITERIHSSLDSLRPSMDEHHRSNA